MQEGVIAGIPAIEVWDWTIGEILSQVRATHERRRRDGQMLSSVAVGEVQMIAGIPVRQERPGNLGRVPVLDRRRNYTE